MLYWQVLGGHRTVTTEHEEVRRGMRGIMDLDYSWNALLVALKQGVGVVAAGPGQFGAVACFTAGLLRNKFNSI